MPYIALLAAGAVFGWLARATLEHRFPLLFRTQQLALGAPMALLSGWALQFNLEFTTTLAAVAMAEWATLFIARRRMPILQASAAHANAGFWAIPVTANLIPEALPLAVVNGMFGLLRGAPVLAFFRRASPHPQSTTTGLMDFSPAFALLAGIIAARLGPPPSWTPTVLTTFADFLGVYGMFLIAAAWPSSWPTRPQWRMGATALPVRFVAPLAMMIGLFAVGVPLSPVVWVLALAPVPLNSLVQTRVYGLDHHVATTQLVLTAGLATVALPLTAALTGAG